MSFTVYVLPPVMSLPKVSLHMFFVSSSESMPQNSVNIWFGPCIALSYMQAWGNTLNRNCTNKAFDISPALRLEILFARMAGFYPVPRPVPRTFLAVDIYLHFNIWCLFYNVVMNIY
jgi:hypothetical protein